MFELLIIVARSLFCILQDKSFTFILKTPPASVLLLKAAGTIVNLSIFYVAPFINFPIYQSNLT
jgi:hypothetical protein